MFLRSVELNDMYCASVYFRNVNFLIKQRNSDTQISQFEARFLYGSTIYSVFNLYVYKNVALFENKLNYFAVI